MRFRLLTTARFCVCGAGALLLSFGCQSIAGVEDVHFDNGPCRDYCASVMESCPGDLSVYENTETCMAVCRLLDPGTTANPIGNTVACRAEQARSAALVEGRTDKSLHCPAAGPGGADQCGNPSSPPDCEGYCTIYSKACSDHSAAFGFGTVEECVQKCAAIEPVPNGAYSQSSAQASGDTLACRMYAASAASLDPITFCDAAGLRPAGLCQGELNKDPECENYCQAVQVACADHAVYESKEQCLAVCAHIAPGTRADTGGQDTVGCRNSHAFNALLIDPARHCPHAGPDGDGVCSEKEDPNCVPYCRYAAAACPTEFTLAYLDEAGCLEACRQLPDAAGGNKYSVESAASGDTLKCRTLNAARALAGSTGACAAVFGAAPCN